jgi:predicted  nucleic acid-binding Zn-ribbon protein
MTPEASKIRDRLRRAEHELEAAKGAVANLEATCKHAFSTPVSDPIIRQAYSATSQAWHPGRGRTCETCGAVQYTTQTEQHVTLTPRF